MWITRSVLALTLALSLAGCGKKSKPPQNVPPPDTVDVALLGSACGADGACPTGTACAKYFGIAGPSGPEFSSCEVSCAASEPCPTGSSCTTIADGPGA